MLSQVVLRQRELLLHLKSRPLPKWHTLGDLAHLKFGATIGYTYTAEFWAMANAGSCALPSHAGNAVMLSGIETGSTVRKCRRNSR